MENNNYPGQIPGQQIGTGEGESPIIKSAAPNMDVRTMASDMQSVNSGSSVPKPYAPQTVAPANVPPAPSPVTPPPDQSFQIPQMDVGGNKPSEPAPKKSSKGVFTAIIVVIIVIGLAALGYFVIYPIFFAAPATPAQNPPAQPVTPTEPIPNPEPVPPEPTSTAPVPPAPAPHTSLFTTPADSQIEASAITSGSALSGLVLNTTASPSLTEIVYKDSNDNLTRFSDILNGALGLDITSNPALASAFNDQTATGLVYTDANGTRWLGFAAQLTAGANASAAFQQSFEAIASYSNLFASDPGTIQTWKDGQIAGVTGNRYLLFGNSGFAIDYGWVGNKLVIMTSYSGFKEVVNRLK